MMQSIRTFRAPAATLGIRQRVASDREEVSSENLVRPMVMILLAAIGVVFTMSQFLHWRIDNNRATLDQLQSVRRDVGSKNISLLAARARLMSVSHVEAVAAARLQLYRPVKGQQHRL
jgi:hypothetical protein